MRVGECAKAPVVVLVMEGDYVTLKAAKEAVESDIPVLVFNGFRKAAYFIAEAYKIREKPLVIYGTTNTELQTLLGLRVRKFPEIYSNLSGNFR